MTEKEIWQKIEEEASDIIDEWQSYGVMPCDLDDFVEKVYNNLMKKYGII